MLPSSCLVYWRPSDVKDIGFSILLICLKHFTAYFFEMLTNESIIKTIELSFKRNFFDGGFFVFRFDVSFDLSAYVINIGSEEMPVTSFWFVRDFDFGKFLYLVRIYCIFKCLR